MMKFYQKENLIKLIPRSKEFRTVGIAILLHFFSACAPEPGVMDYTQFVNPFIGTSGTGHTFPGATAPFGMVQLSPQTGNNDWQYCSGYQYKDTLVYGFGHTYLNGTGIGDLGDILVLPFAGKVDSVQQMDKSKEMASPGYYSAFLSDAIEVRLTATPHTGFHRYTFGEGGKSYLLINIDNNISTLSGRDGVVSARFNIESAQVISGHLRSQSWVERQVFFYIRFSKPFDSGEFLEGSGQRKFVAGYEQLDEGEHIEVQIGLSTVNIAGAKQNLDVESAGNSFEEIRDKAKANWNQYLSKVSIEGSKDQKINFYTSLYHLFIQPNNIADVDGKYRGADDSVYVSPSGKYYSTFSLWDTYRAAHPLYTIIAPDRNEEFVSSMLDHYDVQGYLPIWTLWGKENHCMIGNHSVPVIVDAYLKGGNIDGERAFEAIKTSLTENNWSKYNWSLYDRYGYLPSDLVKTEAVSRTLEASFDDWCAAKLAKALAKEKEAEFFHSRAGFYRNLFDTTTLLMRGKNSDGSWVEPFEPLRISHAGTGDGDYTEGNAWQYTWHVQHDVEGLVGLMGGKKVFTRRLDSLFSMSSAVHGAGWTGDVSGLIGQYAHGNEPSQHVIYLYNYSDKPYKSQELIPEVLKGQYKSSPDGLSGNDDCGQMSAWYIFSTLGFYPVNPASGQYVFGAPQVKAAQVSLPKNRMLKIVANNFSEKNSYVKSIDLNGNKIDRNFIKHEEIMQGGTLTFEMSDQPATSNEDKPLNFSEDQNNADAK